MRLIQNMTTITEFCTPENQPLSRVIKIAVVGGSGVGKTGKNANRSVQRWASGAAMNNHCGVSAALVVRFLTRRFIGDYERNAGEFRKKRSFMVKFGL